MEDVDFSLRPNIVDSPYRYQSISIGGSILSSPTIKDNKIVFGCNDTNVYCLDMEGNKLWSVKTEDVVFSSPTVYEDLILIGSADGFLYAISFDGEVKWKFLAGDKIYSTPLIVDRTVYFGSNNGYFRALSIEDGKELWKYYHSPGIFMMSASAANDMIFSGHLNGDIFCLSKEGKPIWKVHTGDHTTQTPLVLDDRNTVLCSFEKRSLEGFPKGENCKIFLASGDGFFRCIDAENGHIEWKFFCNRTGSSCPTFWKNTFYFGSQDGYLYAVGNNGKLKWKYLTGNRIVPSPVVYDKVVYFGSSDHNIYALDAITGELKWRFLTNGEIISSPTIENNVLYACSWDCHVYAIDVATKELLWRFRTGMSTPSFIKKPTTASSVEERGIIHRNESTVTTRGKEVEKQYSAWTGELTNTFYGSPVAYNKKKTPYDFKNEVGKYKE